MSAVDEILGVTRWLRDVQLEAVKIRRHGARRAETRAREQGNPAASDGDTVYVRPRRGTSLAPIATAMQQGMAEQFERGKR